MTRQPIGLHAYTHYAGGSDPVPSGGIDFNKTNNADSSGTTASYLDEEITGTSPLLIAAVEFGQFLTTGDQENVGERELISSSGTHSSQIMQNSSGQTRILNTADGILIQGTGAGDINGATVKVNLGTSASKHFIVESGETVTRNGSFVITAITSNKLLDLNKNTILMQTASGISGTGEIILNSGLTDIQTTGARIAMELSATNRMYFMAAQTINLSAGNGSTTTTDPYVELDDNGGGNTTLYLQAKTVEIGHTTPPTTTTIKGIALNIGESGSALAIIGTLQTTAPTVGSKVWWNNGGVVTIA